MLLAIIIGVVIGVLTGLMLLVTLTFCRHRYCHDYTERAEKSSPYNLC